MKKPKSAAYYLCMVLFFALAVVQCFLRLAKPGHTVGSDPFTHGLNILSLVAGLLAIVLLIWEWCVQKKSKPSTEHT
jgi:hypothetical protein